MCNKKVACSFKLGKFKMGAVYPINALPRTLLSYLIKVNEFMYLGSKICPITL